MNRFRMLTTVTVLVLAVAPAAAGAAAVSPPLGARADQPKFERVLTDRIAVGRLTRTLSQGETPTTSIQDGATVRLDLEIRNKTSQQLDVPWRMVFRNQVIASGRTTVPGGQTAHATGSFAPVWTLGGAERIDAEADPDNTLGEPPLDRANNRTSLAVEIGPMRITFRPEFFTTGILAGLFNVDMCSVVLQTGPTGSRFTPSDELRGFGVTDVTFQVPTIDQDRDDTAGYVRRWDVPKCAEFRADLRNRGKECPFYRDDPVNVKYHLKADLNDLRTDSSGVLAVFRGTQLVLSMKFEEDGDEITGSVSKKVPGDAEVSTRMIGQMSNITLEIIFDIFRSGDAIGVQFASLNFSTDLALSFSGFQVSPSVMSLFNVRNQVVRTVNQQATAAMRQSGFAAALAQALNRAVQSFAMERVTAVRAGVHGGTDVEGRRRRT